MWISLCVCDTIKAAAAAAAAAATVSAVGAAAGGCGRQEVEFRLRSGTLFSVLHFADFQNYTVALRRLQRDRRAALTRIHTRAHASPVPFALIWSCPIRRAGQGHGSRRLWPHGDRPRAG